MMQKENSGLKWVKLLAESAFENGCCKFFEDFGISSD